MSFFDDQRFKEVVMIASNLWPGILLRAGRCLKGLIGKKTWVYAGHSQMDSFTQNIKS